MRKSEIASDCLALIVTFCGVIFALFQAKHLQCDYGVVIFVAELILLLGFSEWLRGFSESLFADIFKENK